MRTVDTLGINLELASRVRWDRAPQFDPGASSHRTLCK
jgi:hypothetical protein